jgi:hypothetical protein
MIYGQELSVLSLALLLYFYFVFIFYFIILKDTLQFHIRKIVNVLLRGVAKKFMSRTSYSRIGNRFD